MQSNNPNLQMIPVRKERGREIREIRAAFVPRNENYVLLAADYSQIELTYYGGIEQRARECSSNGTDIHTVTASKVYKVDPNEVTRENARQGKDGQLWGSFTNFGVRTSATIEHSEEGGIGNHQELFRKVSWRSTLHRRDHRVCERKRLRENVNRSSTLLAGDINSRNHSMAGGCRTDWTMHSPIQGTTPTAADMLKLAMIRVFNLLREGEYKTKMLLTVHDEIVFDLHRDERDELLKRCRSDAKRPTDGSANRRRIGNAKMFRSALGPTQPPHQQ